MADRREWKRRIYAAVVRELRNRGIDTDMSPDDSADAKRRDTACGEVIKTLSRRTNGLDTDTDPRQLTIPGSHGK